MQVYKLNITNSLGTLGSMRFFIYVMVRAKFAVGPLYDEPQLGFSISLQVRLSHLIFIFLYTR